MIVCNFCKFTFATQAAAAAHRCGPAPYHSCPTADPAAILARVEAAELALSERAVALQSQVGELTSAVRDLRSVLDSVLTGLKARG